jgi:hypothetical protein
MVVHAVRAVRVRFPCEGTQNDVDRLSVGLLTHGVDTGVRWHKFINEYNNKRETDSPTCTHVLQSGGISNINEN